MRTAPALRILVSAGLALAAATLRAEEPAPPAAPPGEKITLVADFAANPSGVFHYSSWKDRLGVSKSGFVVQGSKGAQGNGGLGGNVSPASDLSSEKYVELALGVGALNEVPELTIAFSDADGTQASVRVRIDQLMPQQPVWMRVRRSDFQLASGQDGKDGKMDWTKIAQWHLQGDWTTKKPFHALFIALRTRR